MCAVIQEFDGNGTLKKARASLKPNDLTAIIAAANAPSGYC